MFQNVLHFVVYYSKFNLCLPAKFPCVFVLDITVQIRFTARIFFFLSLCIYCNLVLQQLQDAIISDKQKQRQVIHRRAMSF